MTIEQKQKIRQLRQSGYGYATIAEALGLTKNQVSAFCRRNALTGTKAEPHTREKLDVNCCRCCGKPLVQTPGRKPVKFCSDSCRVSWWNTHPEMVNKKAIYHFACACCGKDLISCEKSIKSNRQCQPCRPGRKSPHTLEFPWKPSGSTILYQPRSAITAI
jgi:hypothetical protein